MRKSQVRLSALCRAEGCTTCKVSLVDVLLLASAEQKPGARPMFQKLLLASAALECMRCWQCCLMQDLSFLTF